MSEGSRSSRIPVELSLRNPDWIARIKLLARAGKRWSFRRP